MARKIIKPIQDIPYTIKVYYGSGYIGSKDIRIMFGLKADSSVAKMKNMVREEEAKRDIPVAVPRHINTKIAFEVWGINVKELEKNMKKLEELGL